jgi:PEP-CTERM motif-containing protein
MKLTKWACAAALGLAAVGGPAEASVVIDVTEVGGNVVTTGSGTVDLAGLTLFSTGGTSGGVVEPVRGTILLGPGASVDFYAGVTGPTSFGAGDVTFASSLSGDAFGLDGIPEQTIVVPAGYMSGTALSGSATYTGQTFASLGLTPGTYVYTWGSGPTADSLTINIEAIPEPGTWAMMTLGFAALGLAGFRATRKSAARAA